MALAGIVEADETLIRKSEKGSRHMCGRAPRKRGGNPAQTGTSAEDYDIVLMDLQMPEMNGVEATSYIRGTMKSAIPIIAFTVDVRPFYIERCKVLGLNDYFSKPIDEAVS